MNSTFTCADCGGVFDMAWSDEEARAESKEQWGDIPSDDLAVVCDDCYQALMANVRASMN